MTARQAEMFKRPPPRKRSVLMHVCDWPPNAHWPPRDWYDWGMTLVGLAGLALVAVAAKQIIQ